MSLPACEQDVSVSEPLYVNEDKKSDKQKSRKILKRRDGQVES